MKDCDIKDQTTRINTTNFCCILGLFFRCKPYFYQQFMLCLEVSSRIYLRSLFSCGIYLAVSEITEEFLEVVLFKKYGRKYTWERKTFIPLTFLTEKTYSKEDLVLSGAKPSDLWFRSGGNIRFCYDTEMEKIKKTRPVQLKDGIRFEYRPSLITLKGMKSEGDQLW